MIKLWFMPVICLLLIGCDDMPPKCDSGDVKKVLFKILKENLNTKSYEVSFTGNEMIEEFPKAKEYSCQARIILKDKKTGELDSELINYIVFSDDNGKDAFFVQIVDDSE